MSADDLLRQSGPINTAEQPLVSLALSGTIVEAWVTEAHIHEQLSQVSTAVIDFACDTPSLDLNGLLGTEGRLTLHGTDGNPGRHFHGLIEHISQTGQDRSHSYYQIQLITRLGLLNYRHNLRIFQQQSVIEIIQTILQEHQIEGDTLSLNLLNSYSPIDYCVQYRETDLAFIQRLMSQNGLYSHVEHNSDHHILHINDNLDAHTRVPASTIPWAKPTGLVHDQALIHTLSSQHAIHTQSSSLSDYNFHKPALSLQHTHSSTQQSHTSGLEHYDYPGHQQEPSGLQQQAQIHQQSHDANQQQLIGTGSARQLQPGYRFDLDNHPDHQANQGYLITSVQQIVRQPQVLNEQSSNEESYSYQGSFTAIPEQIQYQSPVKPKPSVNGVQTAIVTGPEGEEIYTDEYGRVKVQFHWDREGQYNEQSSCWIRVGQSWAGNGYGQVAIPRIGQEVIVDFINGDPDKPIITGSVYHGINRPPYALPENKTRTVFKSKTHQGQGSNEIRFEDAAGQEEVYVHAQKDYNSVTENDKSAQVGNDKSASVGHDETLTVGNDRTRSVGNDETVSVGNDQRLTINNDQFVTIGRNQQVTIEKDKIESVNNHRKESTYANHWRETGGDYGHKVLGSVTREVVDRIVIEADDFTDMAAEELILKGPGGQLKISSSGVELKAKSIKVKSPAISFSRGNASPLTKFTDEKNTGENIQTASESNFADALNSNEQFAGVVNPMESPESAEDVEELPEEILTSKHAWEQYNGLAQKLNAYDFISWSGNIFGYDIPIEAFEKLHDDLKAESVKALEIKVVSGSYAAYDNQEQKILVGKNLIKPVMEDDENAKFKLYHILIEEYGHHIDNLLRNEYSSIGGDAKKDEGAMFAFLMADMAFDRKSDLPFADYEGEYGSGSIALDFSVPYQVFSASEKGSYVELDGKTDDGRYEFFSAGRGDPAHGKYGHQSIEDALKTIGITDEIELLEIYYGNWLRDYSQVVDPKLLELDISVDQSGSKKLKRNTLTRLVEVLAKVEFQKLFNKPDTSAYRLTDSKLGLYLPAEHLDNPRGLEGTTSDPGFRDAYRPVEGAIDSEHWYKNYFEDSIQYIEQELANAVSQGPNANGRRHFGQALHVLEDLYAHSNYIELLLKKIYRERIENHEPVVWSPTRTWTKKVKLPNGEIVEPLVTGTFGAVDTMVSFLSILQKHLAKVKEFKPGERAAGTQIMLILMEEYDLNTAKTIDAALVDLENCKKNIFVCRALEELTNYLFASVMQWIKSLLAYIANEVLMEIPHHQPVMATDPTHTQLAKDHDEHPLHVLAVNCAKSMVAHMGTSMQDAWCGHISTIELQKRARDLFIHPEKLGNNVPEPINYMLHDAGTWADRNIDKVRAANKYTGHIHHAQEELEKIANDSFVIESVKFLKSVKDYLSK